jgi:hypothetical protein
MPIGTGIVYNAGDLILSQVSGSGTAFLETKIAAATSSIIYFDNTARINSASLNIITVGTASYVSGSRSIITNLTASNISASGIGSFGMVGIGTTSPSEKLHVVGNGLITSGSAVDLRIDVSGTGNASLTIDRQTTGAESKILLLDGNVSQWGIAAKADSNNFVIRDADSTERFTILKSGGNVGIGTSSPASKLHISGSGQTIMRLDSDTTSSVSQFQIKAASDAVLIMGMQGGSAASTNFGVTAAGQAYFGTSTLGSPHPTSLVIGNVSNIPIVFSTTNTERMRILSDGNVGIGTTVPVAKLQVAGNISGSSFTSSISNAVGFLGTSSWAQNVVSASFALTSSYINPSGNAFVQGGNSFGTTALLGTNDANSLAFETNGSTRMTINSGGQVGIGVSPVSHYKTYIADTHRGSLGSSSLYIETAQNQNQGLATSANDSGINNVYTVNNFTSSAAIQNQASFNQMIIAGSGSFSGSYRAERNGILFSNSASLDSSGNIVNTYLTNQISSNIPTFSIPNWVAGTQTYVDLITGNSTGSITNLYNHQISSPFPSGGSGGITVNNSYGIYIAKQKTTNIVTNGWGIYQVDTGDLNIFAGKTRIGSTTVPVNTLDVTGNISASAITASTISAESSALFVRSKTHPLYLLDDQTGTILARVTNNNPGVGNSSDFILRSGSTDVVRLSTAQSNYFLNNNVGIGTTVPAYLLDVSGSSRHGYRLSDNHYFTGSVNISGSVTAISFTGSLSGSVSNALTASYLTPANSYTITNLTASNISASGYVSASRFWGVTGTFTNISSSGPIVVSGSNAYIQLLPVGNIAIPTNTTASYIYVSGSTNDLYFTQYQGPFTNTTRLRWLESNMYTGILFGGQISSTPGSTTFNVKSGSGLIVSMNATTGSDPYPTIKQLSWPDYNNQPITNSGSAKITYVGLDNTGQIVQQTNAWGSTDINQWDEEINLGVVLTLSGSVSTGVFNSPQISYGYAQKTDDFTRAFGPLKISGHTLQASGSGLSIQKTGGTAFREGANYYINPNHPSTVVENAITVSKIYRYYMSGSTPIIDTGVNNAGYTTLDIIRYNNNGVLTLLAGSYNNQFTLQRVYWIPNSPTNAFIVYYGNAVYTTLLDAINAVGTEAFTEAPNTALNAIELATIVIEGDSTNLTTANKCTIVQSGLFRNVGGVGSGGTTPVVTSLDSLSDVAISGPSQGDLLIYGNGTQWVNSKTLVGAYKLTGSLSTNDGVSVISLSASVVSASSLIVNNITSSGPLIYDNAVLLDYGSVSTPVVSTNYVVLQNLTGSYNSAFFDYFASSGSNFRAGTVIAGWSGSSVNYTEYATTDVGNTNQLSMSVDLSGSFVRLLTRVSTTINWNIKSAGRYL